MGRVATRVAMAHVRRCSYDDYFGCSASLDASRMKCSSAPCAPSETRNKLLTRPVPLKHLTVAKYYPSELFKHEIRLRPFFSDAFIYSIAIICCDENTQWEDSRHHLSRHRVTSRGRSLICGHELLINLVL